MPYLKNTSNVRSGKSKNIGTCHLKDCTCFSHLLAGKGGTPQTDYSVESRDTWTNTSLFTLRINKVVVVFLKRCITMYFTGFEQRIYKNVMSSLLGKPPLW